MDQGALVMEEIEAGAELVRLMTGYAPIKAAFWLKIADNPNRHLYLASEQFDDAGTYEAYGEVVRLMATMRSPYLDAFRVKVVGGADRFAEAAADINERFPGRTGTRFGPRSFGGVDVDDVYIYPATVPAAMASPSGG